MVKHNNLLPNQHFRKDWKSHVRTWFDQPGKKKSRRVARVKRALKVAPRPLDTLKPSVRCPTLKYNTKLRLGRGFTLEELKAANVRKREALTIGISVDHRRKNRNVESFEQNVLRLKEYKSKLIILKGKDVVPENTSTRNSGVATQVDLDTSRAITGEPKNAFAVLRKARSDKKLKGAREARAKARAEEEAQKKK